MEVVNRKSKTIAFLNGRAQQRNFVTVANHRIYFTAYVTSMCELKVGLYVHFLNEDSEWRFYVNDDPDGFNLTISNKTGGFFVTNSGLTKMILKSMGGDTKHSRRFNVEETGGYQDKCPIFLLSTKNVSTVNR